MAKLRCETQIICKVFEPLDIDEHGRHWRCFGCIGGIESRRVDRAEVRRCPEDWAQGTGGGVVIKCGGCDQSLAQADLYRAAA